VVNTLARAAVSDQREWGGARRRATQALSQGAIHNVAHSLVPLSSAEFRLAKEIIIYNEGGSHTYEHIYAKPRSSRLVPYHRPILMVLVSATPRVFRG
jgi:hypothetical protein